MIPASTPAPADVLSAVNSAAARGGYIRLDFRWFATVPSTMDLAQEAALAGASEGLVIAAEEQTQGRGRRGRVWCSPPGAGLYLTFVFRPQLAAGSVMLPLLTLATGVAVRAAIGQATGFLPELKWPNDLMAGPRKLAGILCEGLAIGSPNQTVLVGIGVNVLAAPYPRDVAARATSLQSELGHLVDRSRVLEELLVSVPETYRALSVGNLDDILHSWRRASPSAVGRQVEWHDSRGVHRGTTAGIDSSGALLVTTAAGLERVFGGELSWM